MFSYLVILLGKCNRSPIWLQDNENICLDLHMSNRSPIRWQGKKISVLTFISLIGLQLDDKVCKYLSQPSYEGRVRYVLILSYGWRSITLVKDDRYFPTLSSGWGPSRLMKVETDIFLPYHLVGDLLEQNKKIYVSTFICLIGLQPDDKIRKYLFSPSYV
jgi:hypothetical protein